MKNKFGILFIMFILINGVALSQSQKELKKELKKEQEKNKVLKSLISDAMSNKLDSLISVNNDLITEIEKLKKDTADLRANIDRLSGSLSLKNTQPKVEIKDVLLSTRIFTDESNRNKIKYLNLFVLAIDKISEIKKLELEKSKKKELERTLDELDNIIGEIEDKLEEYTSEEQKEYYKNNIRRIFDEFVTKY